MKANPYMVRFLAIIAGVNACKHGDPFTISDILELAAEHGLAVAHRSNVFAKLEVMVEAGVLERLTDLGKGRGVEYKLSSKAIKILNGQQLVVMA